MRTFLAFEVDSEVQEKLESMTHLLKKLDRSVRWVKSEHAHVTVHFFGEIDPAVIPRIERIIEDAVSGISPFELRVRGISAFPSISRARVIWYGIESHTQLLTLHRAVAQGLKGKNLVEQLDTRQYTPHITVGRAKGRVNSLLLDEIRRHENEDFGKTIMDSLILFKSTLSQKGPVYERLLSFSL